MKRNETKLNIKQSTAIGFEVGIQNGTLALVVSGTLIGNNTMMIPAVTYSLLMFITGAIFGYLINKKNNLIIANKGLVDGINIGAGMLDKGFLAGRVVGITNDKALVFPITHRKPRWSVRINSDGPEGVMTWDGDDLTKGTVRDVFKAALILPGNSVITTGFQGVFPPGIEIGTVLKVESNDDDNFQTISIELGADFYSIRYVEFIQNRDNLSIDSLINSIE